jgi:hypothetical protein
LDFDATIEEPPIGSKQREFKQKEAKETKEDQDWALGTALLIR